MKKKVRTYTTTGSVRGPCGHNHRSIAAAYKCIMKDARACASIGGYSDRVIIRTDRHPLEGWELEELEDCQGCHILSM